MASISGDFSTNLSAHWEMEETSGTRYDSHSSNDLTDNNTVGYSSSGVQGNAASFNGSTEFLSRNYSSLSGLTPTGDFSISAWFYANALTGNHSIFSLGWTSSLQGYIFRLVSAGTAIAMTSRTDSSYEETSWSYSFNTGEWYHVVFVRDQSAGTWDLYINGSAQTQKTGMSTASISYVGSPALRIGARNSNGGITDYFNALIDEVSFWDGTALSSANVSSIYAGGSGIPYAAAASGPANMKTLDTIATASVKTINGTAIASVKTINTIA